VRPNALFRGEFRSKLDKGAMHDVKKIDVHYARDARARFV